MEFPIFGVFVFGTKIHESQRNPNSKTKRRVSHDALLLHSKYSSKDRHGVVMSTTVLATMRGWHHHVLIPYGYNPMAQLVAAVGGAKEMHAVTIAHNNSHQLCLVNIKSAAG